MHLLFVYRFDMSYMGSRSILGVDVGYDMRIVLWALRGPLGSSEAVTIDQTPEQ